MRCSTSEDSVMASKKRRRRLQIHGHNTSIHRTSLTSSILADRREFIKISQAVGMGFLIMGAIGYFIKLSKSPLSNSYITHVILAHGARWRRRGNREHAREDTESVT